MLRFLFVFSVPTFSSYNPDIAKKGASPGGVTPLRCGELADQTREVIEGKKSVSPGKTRARGTGGSGGRGGRRARPAAGGAAAEARPSGVTMGPRASKPRAAGASSTNPDPAYLKYACAHPVCVARRTKLRLAARGGWGSGQGDGDRAAAAAAAAAAPNCFFPASYFDERWPDLSADDRRFIAARLALRAPTQPDPVPTTGPGGAPRAETFRNVSEPKLCCIVINDPLALARAPTKMRSNAAALALATESHPRIIDRNVANFLGAAAESRDAAMRLLRCSGGLLFKLGPRDAHGLRRDPEAIRMAFVESRLPVRSLTPAMAAEPVAWCDDPLLVRDIVGRTGSLLKFVPAALQNNGAVVLAAVRSSGGALEYASETLRGNRQVVETAVRQFGMALRYASDKLKADRDLVLTAVLNTKGAALACADPSLQKDADLVRTAISLDGRSIRSAAAEWRRDPRTAEIAVRDNPWAIEFVDLDETAPDLLLRLANAALCQEWRLVQFLPGRPNISWGTHSKPQAAAVGQGGLQVSRMYVPSEAEVAPGPVYTGDDGVWTETTRKVASDGTVEQVISRREWKSAIWQSRTFIRPDVIDQLARSALLGWVPGPPVPAESRVSFVVSVYRMKPATAEEAKQAAAAGNTPKRRGIRLLPVHLIRIIFNMARDRVLTGDALPMFRVKEVAMSLRHAETEGKNPLRDPQCLVDTVTREGVTPERARALAQVFHTEAKDNKAALAAIRKVHGKYWSAEEGGAKTE